MRPTGNGPQGTTTGPQGNPLGARCFWCPADSRLLARQTGYLTMAREYLEEIAAWIWLNRGAREAHKFWALYLKT